MDSKPERPRWSWRDPFGLQAARLLQLEQFRAIQTTQTAALTSLLAQVADARKDATDTRAATLARADADRAAYLAALTALRDVAEGQNQVVAGLTAAMQAYLALFKVEGEVTGHTHTDLTEWRSEQQTARETGFDPLGRPVDVRTLYPVDGSPEEQLAWVLHQSA